MKKNIKFSLIVSVIINTICFLVNLIGALVFKTAPLTKSLVGGEVIEYIGFGVLLDEYTPLTDMNNPAPVTTEVHVHFMSLLVSLVIIALIAFIIKTVVDKIKGDK